MRHEAGTAMVIALQHSLEEAFLAAETGVNAWRVYAHGPGQIGHGGALVTLAPKNRHCPVECFFLAKRSRATRPHGCFLFLYGSLYNSLDEGSPVAYLYRSLQISRGLPMTHLDIVQAQKYLRQRANEPAKTLRRRATGAALLLVL